MVTLKPIKLLPARERVASALRKAIISKQITEGEVITLESTAQHVCALSASLLARRIRMSKYYFA